MRRAFAVSSGKAALAIILRALNAMTGRRKVIIPAYTCYSVPSAIVRAGLEVVPCDIAPGSFDYDYERLASMLDRSTLCVLSVHLFGIPADTARLQQLCRANGIAVVEDAAQAMGISAGETLLGTRGDVGFFSAGRGKTVTCGGGGIVVTSSAAISDALFAALESVDAPGASDDVTTGLSLILLGAFINPALYWLPSGLPFLRLGETIFHADFAIRRLSDFQARLLARWPETLAALNAVRREHSLYYERHVDGAERRSPRMPYLRFPVVLDEGSKQSILGDSRARALGITGMYPSTVAGIRELGGHLRRTSFPQAERVAASLITLPTHPLLSEAERARISTLVNDTVRQSNRSHKVWLAS